MVRQSLGAKREGRLIGNEPIFEAITPMSNREESYPLAPGIRKMLKQLLFPGFYWRSQSAVSTIAAEAPCFAKCRRIISEL
jgi:hypothetical protein